MGDDLDVRSGDVRVFLNEVSAKNASKEFGRGDRVLFSFDIDGILHGVGSYYHAIICFGVPVYCQ